MTENTKNKKSCLLWAACLLALAAFGAAMIWLHYQQLCSPGGGSDPYTSDLGQHLAFAQRGMVYSTVSLLIGPAYALAGRIGIAVLLAAVHLAAVAVFAYGLHTALPNTARPVRLLVNADRDGAGASSRSGDRTMKTCAYMWEHPDAVGGQEAPKKMPGVKPDQTGKDRWAETPPSLIQKTGEKK